MLNKKALILVSIVFLNSVISFSSIWGRNELKLIRAVNNNNLIEVTNLIKSGVDINETDESGFTALRWAAFNGLSNIVKVLIENGAKVDTKDIRNGNTPLMEAAFVGNGDIGKMLFYTTKSICEISDAIAKIDKTNNLKIINMLITAGADVNAKNNHGQTSLILAAHFMSGDIIKHLLAAGAYINERTKNGSTALINAVCYCNIDAIKILIEKGADVKIKDEDGDTALSLAIKRRNNEIVDILKTAESKEYGK